MGTRSIHEALVLTHSLKPQNISEAQNLEIQHIDTTKEGGNIKIVAHIGKEKKFYETILTFPENQKSIHSKDWKARVGTDRQWENKPPQNDIRAIYTETKDRWTKEQIAYHRNKRGLYENVADYNEKVHGIHPDFIFRYAEALFRNGHLYGNFNYSQEYANKLAEVIDERPAITLLPKYLVKLITLLMESGILKNTPVE